MTTHTPRSLAATLALVLALTGCGPMFETDPTAGNYGHGTTKELGELLNRRDAEDVLADRDHMITEITTELTRIVPGSQWPPTSEDRASHCGEFGSTKGRFFISAHYTSDVPIPAALWDQASQAVIDIAAKYGYTDVRSRTENATDDHATDLTIYDQDGGRLAFGSMVAASMYVGTGCYLTAEDKRKAREAAPQMTTHTPRCLAATLALVLALTGCGPMFETGYTGPAEGDYGYGTTKELGELLNRRDAEDVLADRDHMITEITTELTRIVPGSQWPPTSKDGPNLCGAFGSTKARSYTSAHYTSDVPIPAALWNQVSQAVIDIAAKYGYTDVQNTENPTDEHGKRLVITDSHDGTLTLGSMVAANLYVRTGCYLTAEDKRKAREAAPK